MLNELCGTYINGSLGSFVINHNKNKRAHYEHEFPCQHHISLTFQPLNAHAHLPIPYTLFPKTKGKGKSHNKHYNH